MGDRMKRFLEACRSLRYAGVVGQRIDVRRSLYEELVFEVAYAQSGQPWSPLELDAPVKVAGILVGPLDEPVELVPAPAEPDYERELAAWGG